MISEFKPDSEKKKPHLHDVHTHMPVQLSEIAHRHTAS